MTSSVATLPLVPSRKNSRIDCAWAMPKAEAMHAQQAGGSAEDHDEEGVHDVAAAAVRTGRADGGEGRAGDAGDAAAEGEGEAVHLAGVDADGAAHLAVLHGGAQVEAEAERYMKVISAMVTHDRESEHEHAVDRDVEAFLDVEGTHQPLGQGGGDLAGAEDGAVGLLQNQAEPPGREQGVERSVVKMSYHRATRRARPSAAQTTNAMPMAATK